MPPGLLRTEDPHLNIHGPRDNLSRPRAMTTLSSALTAGGPVPLAWH